MAIQHSYSSSSLKAPNKSYRSLGCMTASYVRLIIKKTCGDGGRGGGGLIKCSKLYHPRLIDSTLFYFVVSN